MVSDAVMPKEIVRNDEIGHGRQLERDGGGYPETAPVIALENEVGQQPVYAQIHHGARTAGEHKHDKIVEDLFT